MRGGDWQIEHDRGAGMDLVMQLKALWVIVGEWK